MEFKVGDKVRVSKDAPKMYLRGQAYFFIEDDCKVDMVEGDNAVITNGPCIIAIPTKYLVKVEAEAKEAKYKTGDKVRVKGSVLLEGGVFSIIGADYHEKLGWRYELNIHEWYPEIDLDLYTKPTDQTEAEKTDSDNLKEVAEEWANTVSNAIKEYDDVLCKTYIDAHNEAYWDAYTADLAREIAVKSMEKSYGCDPERIADYAVSVAKAVVEGLKRK